MSSLCKTCKFKNTKKAEGVLCGDSEAHACYSYSSKGPPTLEDLIKPDDKYPDECSWMCPYIRSNRMVHMECRLFGDLGYCMDRAPACLLVRPLEEESPDE